MKIFTFIFCVAVCHILQASDHGQWPQWRGPYDTGEAPLRWSDTETIKWKAAIPGRGHSSPVLWGDPYFPHHRHPYRSSQEHNGGPLDGAASARPSPAIADGEIILRGQNTLFSISEKR